MRINFFRKFKISTILMSGFTTMVVLILLIGGAAFWGSNSMGITIDVVFDRLPLISGMKAMGTALSEANVLTTALTYLDPQSEGFEMLKESYEEKLDGATMDWGTFLETIQAQQKRTQTTEEEKALISDLKNAFEAWQETSLRVIPSLSDASFEERENGLEEVGDSLFDALDALGYLENYSMDIAKAATEKGKTDKARANRVLIGVCSAGLFAAIVLSLLITRIIVKPLRILTEGVSRMADGNLKMDLDTTTRLKELSLLMRGFSAMLNTLRDQVSGLTDGANTIAVSTSQISTTATELAATASEASISVNEITTTTEEVKQTVQLSSEKANQVAEAAEEVTRVANRGRQATEDAVSGMSRIKEEMEYIAESIVKLSEQTQSIGEIIDAVNDLANESNLLSVNASIEAAKAGEFGKGFAVVAQEVKSLSDQSKQATAQVRNILNDIQNATSQAVMATERGSKAVDAGVDLASSSGHAIRALSESIGESSRSAAQIAASSSQQLAGIDQLSQAMASIQDAAGQNVDGAKRLEDATMDLSEIAGTLKELANRFKI